MEAWKKQLKKGRVRSVLLKTCKLSAVDDV